MRCVDDEAAFFKLGEELHLHIFVELLGEVIFAVAVHVVIGMNCFLLGRVALVDSFDLIGEEFFVDDVSL